MGIFDRFPYSSTHEMNLDFMLGKATEIAESLQEIDTHKEQAEQAAQAAQASAGQAAQAAQAAAGSQTAASASAAAADQHKTDAEDAANRAEAASDLADEAVEQAQTAAQNANTAADGAIASASAAETRINTLAASLPEDFTDLNNEVNDLNSAIGELDSETVKSVNNTTPDNNGNVNIDVSEYVSGAVDNWLDEHPEATTTVQDESLTEQKFSETLKLKTIKDYVTPQMFGAKGDGVTDDYGAIVDCIEYASENSKNIKFPRSTYAVGNQISIENSINIDFCNSTIVYIGQNVIDNFIVYGFATNVPFSDKPGLTNVKIDGNSKAKNCLHITSGKGILLKNINIAHPVEYGLLIDETGGDTWEILADNITVSGSYGNGQQCITPIRVLGVSDSYFLNLYTINGSDSWLYFTGNGCTIVNLHGYSYPETLTVNHGVYVGGSGNRFVNMFIDTFSAVGILTTTPQNSFINTAFAKPYSNSCIGFRIEANYTTIDGVYCSDAINLISSNANDSLTVKNINTYGVMVKDVVFDNNNIPYWFVYDNSGRATTPITKLIEQNKIVDTSVFVITGATIGSSSVIKKSNGFLRLSFNITCTGSSVEIKTGITLPATQYLFAFNNTQNKIVLFSMWADGSIHNLGVVASGDVLLFDSVVAL